MVAQISILSTLDWLICMPLKPKGFQQFLKDDPSLLNSVSFSEIESQTSAGIDDSAVQTVYDAYEQERKELEDAQQSNYSSPIK